MKKTLFVRPAHDDVTSYLFYYSKELVEESKAKGFVTLNKEKVAANATVVSIIDAQNPEFIMFNGHGNADLICGHNDEVLIRLGENEKLLKTKMIYALTCSSAAQLGRAVADEATTFIGYIDDFALGMDVHCQTSIHRDKRAKLFIEPSNLLVKCLLKGNSAQEAVTKAKEQMKRNISLLRTDPFPDAKDYIPYLFNNYQILEVMGKRERKMGD